MRDVLARLMEWMETSDINDANIVLRDAITEIAGLRARLDEHRLAIRRFADQDATLSVQGGNVIVTMDATLTDAEREAIANGIYLCEGEAGQANENINANAWAKTAGVLRGLLERTQ